MRVTNSMISNNSAIHMANAKNQLMNKQNQYTTQKKILRPSDDPTVAIRALQLRTTYSQLGQYVEKNVKDAMNWMDVTETALKNVSNILTNMKENLNKGANDYLEKDQRNAVLAVLKQYVSSIFEDEANTDYSGRYMFTGYRTDTSLLFDNKTTDLNYRLKENIPNDKIDSVTHVTKGAEYVDGNTAVDYASQNATQKSIYRMQLAYKNCKQPDAGATPSEAPEIKYVKPDGTEVALTVATKKSTDAGAYDAATDGVTYLYDTGEVIFSDGAYSNIQTAEATISVEYNKNTFEKGDIRPEMYFECSYKDAITGRTYNFAEPKDQAISYEINFSQTSVVNTQARDALSTDIYRTIDFIESTIQEMDTLEKKMSDNKTMIDNTTDPAKLEALNKLQEKLEDEKKLRTTVMTEAFNKGLTMVDDVENMVNVSVADLGSRYKRLDLTYDKLLNQRTDTEEKMSNNEDIDIGDAYINLTQADNLYQASLAATSKILGNSLLNYI